MTKPTKAQHIARLNQAKAGLDKGIEDMADLLVALHNFGDKPTNQSDYVLGRTMALDGISRGVWFGQVSLIRKEKDVLLGFASVIAGNPRKALKAAGVKA